MLTAEQRESWSTGGFVLVKGFLSPAQVARLERIHRRFWRRPSSRVTVDDMDTGRRTTPRLLSPDERQHRFKINDLYLQSETIRQIALDRQLVAMLTQLLGQPPVLCNTLSLTHGTQQDPHVDSLYMTPQTEQHLIATWIALEDGHPDAGPLCYYPGSHKIPVYRFSNGHAHCVDEELPRWQEHIRGYIEKWQLEEERLVPEQGDLFIWHAQLLHGGAAIADTKRTRKSIVSHYYSLSDAESLGPPVIPMNGAGWLLRAPHALSPTEREKRAQSIGLGDRLGDWAGEALFRTALKLSQTNLPVARPMGALFKALGSLSDLRYAL